MNTLIGIGIGIIVILSMCGIASFIDKHTESEFWEDDFDD
jgi:hypothetical protein